MKVSICIPTNKEINEVQKQIDDIRESLKNTSINYEIVVSCIKQSASLNRNWVIDNSKGDIIINCDDDITGYYEGWLDQLVNALVENKDFSIVSIRPKKLNNDWCPILGDAGQKPDLTKKYEECLHTKKTGLNIVGSATIAFWRNIGIRFDEKFKGATFEDTDFSMQMKKKYPDKKIMFVNECNLIHNMEAKGRGSSDGLRDYVIHNHDYFCKKWNIII